MKRYLLLAVLAGAMLTIFLAACGAPPEQAPQNNEASDTADVVEVDSTEDASVVVEEEPSAVVETEATETEAEMESGDMSSADWTTAWMLNETGETSGIFSNVLVNVTSVTVEEIDGVQYQRIVASGIPSYETTISQQIIDLLNSRPNAATDFENGTTPLSVGDVVGFGGDVGFRPSSGCSDGSEGYGYWPFGPACPQDQAKDQFFPLNPELATEVCGTGLNDMGTWVNGVGIFNWQDGQSYENAGVWVNEAFHFEFHDLDIDPGHSANGNYHHHSNPVSLGKQLGDEGTAHSPIYGFAADGFPIYGPWHADGELANSCWKARDYEDVNSATGCGVAGERSCLLVDQYDITKGTEPAASNGPATTEIVLSMSSNPFVTTSGYYFQDYYYDASCTEQGVAYLDEHNGHDHDGLGYHYHVTISDNGDGTYEDKFPFYAGPNYAGVLQDNAVGSCSSDDGGPGGPPPGDDSAEGGQDGGDRPDFAAVATQLGITEAALMDAIGGPPPDLEAASEALGISIEEIEAAMGGG